MPSHHPVAGVLSLFHARRERARIVDELCDRLSAGLGSAVLALEELVEDRAARDRTSRGDREGGPPAPS
jgi:hypothetical protein